MSNSKINNSLALIALLSTFGFSGTWVSAKKNIDLQKNLSNDNVVCTMLKNEKAELLKQLETQSFIKAECGQGYAPNEELTQVVEEKDKNYTMGGIDILGNSGEQIIGILGQFMESNDEASIDRNFNDMLVSTMDRENIEIANGDN